MRIIYTNAEGGVSIVTPVDNCGLTLQEIIDRSVPPNTPHTVVEDDELPADRTYRNSWEIGQDRRTIVHNTDKAKAIHRDIIRAARAERFKVLDVQYTRADERGPAGNADKLAIARERQALRDATDHPGIDAATTPEELKRVWPAELGRNPLQ